MPPVSGSPPRPSMVPSPTTPESIGLTTAMRCLHDELPVPLPAALARTGDLVELARIVRGEQVVPLSSHSVTPAFSVSPADTNAVLSPSVARRTAWPTGQAVIAAWIAARVERLVARLPRRSPSWWRARSRTRPGIVGSAPMASHGGGDTGEAAAARAAAVPPWPPRPARPRCRRRRPCAPAAPPVPLTPAVSARAGCSGCSALRRRPARPCCRRRPLVPGRCRCRSVAGHSRPSTHARAAPERSAKNAAR